MSVASAVCVCVCVCVRVYGECVGAVFMRMCMYGDCVQPDHRKKRPSNCKKERWNKKKSIKKK